VIGAVGGAAMYVISILLLAGNAFFKTFFTCIGKEKYYYIYTLLLFIEKKGICWLAMRVHGEPRCLTCLSMIASASKRQYPLLVSVSGRFSCR
jgi:hypothetical protein